MGRDGRREWGTVREREREGRGREGRWEELPVAFHGVGIERL